MSKRKSRDDVEPPREFPNPFAEYSGGQLLDASGKVETLTTYNIVFFLQRSNAPTTLKSIK